MARVTEVNSVAEITVTDARGRVLTLKRPNVLAQFQLVELLGATAENRVYMAMCLPLLHLQKIDGEMANFANRRELDGLIQRLDDEGMEALQNGVSKNFQQQSEKEAADVAKKSQGMPV